MYLIIKRHDISIPDVIRVTDSASTLTAIAAAGNVDWAHMVNDYGNSLSNGEAISFNIPAVTTVSDEIRGMLRDGKSKIAAIKRFRELTGSSLVESKRFVESLSVGMPGYCRICGRYADYVSHSAMECATESTASIPYDVCSDHITR